MKPSGDKTDGVSRGQDFKSLDPEDKIDLLGYICNTNENLKLKYRKELRSNKTN